MNILITGGAGFIGSNFIDLILSDESQTETKVICLDKLTYAGRKENIAHHKNNTDFEFIHGDIGDVELVASILEKQETDWIVNFAAETHVDRSIDGPEAFIQTNVVGTHTLLKASLHHFNKLESSKKNRFRFLHVSTDEVFGSLNTGEKAFNEETPYAPNSPYSASKAASDHLVRAYHHTFELPTLITNCSNNYGPRQFPEKLIPLFISNALVGENLPIYGDGKNIRDWLYVEDHCSAILEVLSKGETGETYCIGGNCEKTNLDLIKTLCDELDTVLPAKNGNSYWNLRSFVKDRPGHDQRYAIDTSKIVSQLGWSPKWTFESGITKTINWYLSNGDWISSITESVYKKSRLGNIN